jgi:hypothetical protein
MVFFQPFQKTIEVDNSRTVQKIAIRFVVSDVSGTIYVTDVMFQGGSIATMWTGHASEIQWSFDG